MTAKLIDGKAIAARLRSKVAGEVARVKDAHGLTPGIAVVMAGDDPASNVYVRAKSKAVAEAGMLAFDHRLPVDAPEAALLDIIARLNLDDRVHGILVQQPLPKQMDPHDVVEALNPAKDVDGFHPFNAGRLARGLSALVPCTPQACVWLAKSVYPSLAGMEAVVIGRSNIVGKPLVHLLLAEDTTVTIAHSKTRDLPAVCRRADLLVAAVGRPEMIRAEWIKPGAMVVDVGINRVPSEDGKSRIVGDVEAKAREVAGALTPVPGGVGPMTIACLLLNTLRAACAQWKLPQPSL